MAVTQSEYFQLPTKVNQFGKMRVRLSIQPITAHVESCQAAHAIHSREILHVLQVDIAHIKQVKL